MERRSLRGVWVIMGIVCAVLVGMSTPVVACTTFGSEATAEEFRVQSEKPPPDEPPPEQPTLWLDELEIGGSAGTSCANQNAFGVRIESPNEQPGLRPSIGYRLEVVGGSLPPGLELPAYPIAREIDSEEWSPSWIEPISEDVQFTLRAVAVDKWGRTSEPSKARSVFGSPSEPGSMDDESRVSGWSTESGKVPGSDIPVATTCHSVGVGPWPWLLVWLVLSRWKTAGRSEWVNR